MNDLSSIARRLTVGMVIWFCYVGVFICNIIVTAGRTRFDFVFARIWLIVRLSCGHSYDNKIDANIEWTNDIFEIHIVSQSHIRKHVNKPSIVEQSSSFSVFIPEKVKIRQLFAETLLCCTLHYDYRHMPYTHKTSSALA